MEGFASGQMLDSPHHPTGTTEKIDGIGIGQNWTPFCSHRPNNQLAYPL